MNAEARHKIGTSETAIASSNCTVFDIKTLLNDFKKALYKIKVDILTHIWYARQVWLLYEIYIYIAYIYILRSRRGTEAHLHGRDVPEELFNVIIVTAIARRILQSK